MKAAVILVSMIILISRCNANMRRIFKRDLTDSTRTHRMKNADLSSCGPTFCGKIKDFTIAENENNTLSCHEINLGVYVDIYEKESTTHNRRHNLYLQASHDTYLKEEQQYSDICRKIRRYEYFM